MRTVLQLRRLHDHVQRGAMNASASALMRPAAGVDDLAGALAFSAPYLVEKLVKDHVVDTATDAEALFTEVKRYLVLTRLDPRVSWQMYSLRVDEVWHQFVLYTREYAKFCDRYFGEFVHHRPNNAPASPVSQPVDPSTFRGFSARYREVFGHNLPDCWYDERSVTALRRVINEKVGRLGVLESAGRVQLIDETKTVLFSVDSLAAEAVTFVAQTKAFYVRELPGDLTDDERIGIVATLVAQRLLRVAS